MDRLIKLLGKKTHQLMEEREKVRTYEARAIKKTDNLFLIAKEVSITTDEDLENTIELHNRRESSLSGAIIHVENNFERSSTRDFSDRGLQTSI